jgi:hypothetical protein
LTIIYYCNSIAKKRKKINEKHNGYDDANDDDARL